MKGAHMKIIDETGIVLTTEPDLEAGYLVEDVEAITIMP